MKSLKNQLGQSFIEYILLTVVVIAVAKGAFDQIERRLLTDGDSLTQKYLGNFSRMFGGEEGGIRGKYKWFSIRQ